MAKQLFIEDIAEGTDITPLEKVPTSQMLVKWAGSSGDFNPLHYQDTFAAAQGVGKPIVHGQLKRAFMVQMMTDWIGDEGMMRKFSCQFRGMDYPRLMKEMTVCEEEGETLTCKGKVVRKYEANGEHLADCQLWIENNKGDKNTLGEATVALPSRG